MDQIGTPLVGSYGGDDESSMLRLAGRLDCAQLDTLKV